MSAKRTSDLPLWGRWHGVAVTDEVFAAMNALVLNPYFAHLLNEAHILRESIAAFAPDALNPLF